MGDIFITYTLSAGARPRPPDRLRLAGSRVDYSVSETVGWPKPVGRANDSLPTRLPRRLVARLATPQSPSRRYTANSSNRSEVPDEELAQFGTCFETTIIIFKRKAPESALVIAAPPRALFPSALARQRGAAAAPLPAPPAGLRRWVRRSACLLGPWLERQRVRLAASPR